MAITKAHQKIREQKAMLGAQLEAVVFEARNSLKRVPDFVMNGSHQVAVEWKRIAEEFHPDNPICPKRISLSDMKELLTHKSIQARKLCGSLPLVS